MLTFLHKFDIIHICIFMQIFLGGLSMFSILAAERIDPVMEFSSIGNCDTDCFDCTCQGCVWDG